LSKSPTLPSISPVLFHRDLDSASRWLCEAFGFVERTAERVVADGTVVHAELEFGNGLIILSGVYEPFQIPPQTAVHHHTLYVSVAEVDSHCQRAQQHGAQITSELRDTDYGARVYSAQDLAGYHWIFAEAR
jgi:uncharacterized glyoxalase superfamily protein PhnB